MSNIVSATDLRKNQNKEDSVVEQYIRNEYTLNVGSTLPKAATDKNCVAQEDFNFFKELHNLEKVLHDVSPEKRYEMRLGKASHYLINSISG